ncbi:MAG: OmpA family protein [Ignavibacteria bacterium]|nr:OmpA family protein [Ignavibacteria bacterium]
MKKIYISILLFPLILSTLFSVEYVDLPWSNRLSYGLGLNFGLNYHTANFKGIDFPNIPSCCPRFETGLGFNYSIGPSLSIPFGEQISIIVRGGLENLSATLKKTEKEYFSTQGQEGVWGEFEHSVKTTLNGISADLLLSYRLNPQLRISFGPSISLIIKNEFEQKEEIVNPSYGVFAIEKTRIRNHTKGEIPNINKILFGLGLGASYYLPMNETNTLFLVPNLSIKARFNEIAKNHEWKSYSFSGGLSVIFSPRKVKVVKPPVPPPITPPLAELPEPPISPSLEATIVAVSLDEKGNERPVTLLKIEEFLSTKMHPLLGYIFFEENSSEIPKRYKLISENETREFTIKKLYGLSTLDIYYNILNIIGRRVKQFPQAELTIVGYNSDQGVEKGNIELSRKRAETVKNYFVNTWKIEPERIKIVAKNLPDNPSNPNDPDGIQENRRVEIIANIPQIFEPLVVEDTLREVNPPTFRFKPEVKTQIGIDRWQLVTSQSQGVVKVFEGKGDIPKVIEWNVAYEQQNVPKLDEALKYKLIVYDKDNKKWESQTLELPVEVMTIEKKIIEQVADKQIDRFSLILFGFGQSEVTGDNLKIAEIAKKRIKPNSTVKIEGFTDRIGSEQSNLELSTKRALETAKVLGVDPRFAKGLGETRLLYDNSLPEGRFYCRTVNIEIVTPIE